MSLRQPSESDLIPRRRPTKRRLAVESDSDEHEREEPEGPNERNVSPEYTQRSRRQHSNSRSNGSREESQEPDDESTSRKSVPSTGTVTKLKTKAPREGIVVPPKKKQRIIQSEDEDEEDEEDYTEGEHTPDGHPDDEDYVMEDIKPKRRSNVGRGGRAKASSSKAKTKIEREDSIPMKDEHKKSVALKDQPPVDSSKRSRAKPLKTEDIDVDVVGDSIATPDEPNVSNIASPKEESPAPPTTKRKLPTIKKNKVSTSAGPSTPSATALKVNTTFPVLPEATKTTVRKPAATAGIADVDLSNASVYAELFKTAGGTPRSASNRRTKDEERRKELDKMRDDARAARNEQAKHTFDLQSHMEKISRFEEKLRLRSSGALFPNHLAGKLSERYEREKRMKERSWQENENSRGEEEGEITESPSRKVR